MSYSILLCSIDMFLSDVILSLSSSFCLNYDLFFSFLTLSYHTRSFNSIYLQQFWTTFPFGFRLDIRYPSNMERMPCVSSLPPLTDLLSFLFFSSSYLFYSDAIRCNVILHRLMLFSDNLLPSLSNLIDFKLLFLLKLSSISVLQKKINFNVVIVT